MKALILDGGGVVFNEPIPTLLDKMGGDRNLVQQRYDSLFDDFWSGKISKRDFWREMIKVSESKKTPEYWEEFLEGQFDRGPAYWSLYGWSRAANLYLLSNHRSDWARDLLSETEGLFQGIWISEEVGIAKPGQEIFELVLGEIPEKELLFIDDRKDNVAAARKANIPSLLAKGDSWLSEIDAWLGL